jgi:hypothetical protein
MPEFSFSWSLSTLLLVVGSLSALGLAVAVYRITIPPVSPPLRLLLTSLRTLALILLILLIGEPLLSLIARSVDRPTVALLVDNSRSMTIIDRTGDRQEILRSALQHDAVRGLGSAGSVQYALFDSKARFVESFTPDSMSLTGESTDMSAAFRLVKSVATASNIQAVLLLSDGNNTTGISPVYEAENLGVPVFTVGIGDSSEQKDVLVRRVLTNTIVYAGNRVPVNVTIRSAGYGGERVEVTLREGNTAHDRKAITLEPGMRDYTTTLFMTPSEEGTHKFTLNVSSLPGELTERNNRQDIFVKVLKSKMRVTLVAGGPSPDVAFVRRLLEADEDVEVQSFIERGGGAFYEGPLTAAALEKTDCIVLAGFPGPQSSSSAVTTVAGALAGGTSTLFLLGRTVDLTKLPPLEPHLPVVVQPAQSGQAEREDEYQVFLSVPERFRSHPLVEFGTTGQGDLWSRLSPLFTLQRGFRPKPESEVFGVAQLQPGQQSLRTSEPLFVGRNVARRRSLALLGYGLWRWKMLGATAPETEAVVEDFLSNALRWLTTREDDRPVRVQPMREVFTLLEPVEFAGQVYDENYRPVENATVNVAITGGERRHDVSLSPLGSGQYEGSLDALEEGDYRFSATVRVDGNVLAEDRGAFTVGGVNVEFLETRMNKELLQQLSARTGGKYYDAPDLETLRDDIVSLSSFQPREVVKSEDIELWNRGWMLVIVVGLFAAEWFLRKRNGML